MSRRPKRAVAVLLCVTATSCADRRLYSIETPYIENKVTISGQVCTDDPAELGFPVKVLFLVDVSQSMQSEPNDPDARRGAAVDEVLTSLGKKPNFHFGIIAFAGRARSLVAGGFSQDPHLLSGAAMALQQDGVVGGVGGCTPGHCRDIQAALERASSLITGDILAADLGDNARTSYVVLLLTNGPPVPAISRCACRDRQSEVLAETWADCPWSECDTPGAAPVADTFSRWTLPAEHGFDLDQISAFDPSQTPGPCIDACVYTPDGGGNTSSCEERVLVGAVRELGKFVKDNGAGGLQLHTMYLPDAVDYSTMPQSRFKPDCGADADQARTTRLLSEMAFAGGGSYTALSSAFGIDFNGILDHELTPSHFVFKELVVSNLSTLAAGQRLQPDSDQDGLSDVDEVALGTCLSDRDSDGDGISDKIEVLLALDPLAPSDPVECLDVIRRTSRTGNDLCTGEAKVWIVFDDDDGDTLNACEERLLGTVDTLFDSDADGLPDHLEVVAGTSYFASDPLDDIDFDGRNNRIELRQHTDPRSNDVQAQLDLAYRYTEEDQGVKTILRARPLAESGIEVVNISPASTPGVGTLSFDPGPPPTLRWKDPADMGAGGDFGPAVDISEPSSDGYRLTSCRIGADGDCTEESQQRYVTVQVSSGDLSSTPSVENVAVTAARRNCIEFRVANITLLETERDPLLEQRGTNRIEVYFAQTPPGSKTQTGVFRAASVSLSYLEQLGREPPVAEIVLSDDDFVLMK